MLSKGAVHRCLVARHPTWLDFIVYTVYSTTLFEKLRTVKCWRESDRYLEVKKRTMTLTTHILAFGAYIDDVQAFK
jgi:hypothetical protein